MEKLIFFGNTFRKKILINVFFRKCITNDLKKFSVNIIRAKNSHLKSS